MTVATIVVEGLGAYEAPLGKKLVLALEDAGVDILHRCGGKCLCTTCRVEVLDGEVPPMSDAEREGLEEPELIRNYRLSCQLRVQGDLKLRVAKRASVEDLTPGPRPED